MLFQMETFQCNITWAVVFSDGHKWDMICILQANNNIKRIILFSYQPLNIFMTKKFYR